MPNIEEQKKKPVVAIYSTTCCEGCQVAIVNLGARFLEIFKYIDLGDMQIIEEEPDVAHYDIAFIEGTPLTEENIEHVKKIREKSTYVITLGNCATHGCYQGIKNYRDKDAAMNYVYSRPKGINNFDVKGVGAYIKVDFNLYQCPLNAEEFLKFVRALLNGKAPEVRLRPVCYECQLNGTDCLLHRGQMCLGPIILGGCNAPCPSDGNYRCEACRNVLPNAPILSFERKIFQFTDRKELDETLEKFSMKERWYEERAKDEEREQKAQAAKQAQQPAK